MSTDSMMLTRAGVARRLGRSVATVRRMEGHELHPSRDANGVHWFDEDEVESVLEQRETGYASRRSGWLDGAKRGMGNRSGGQVQLRVQEPSTAASVDNEEGWQLARAIGERLSVALGSLSDREMGRIPGALLDAVSDVLAAIDAGDPG